MGRLGRGRNFESARPNQIFANGTGTYIPANRYRLITLFTYRIRRENEAPLDDRSAKKRRLARGIQGVHASDMSLVTPENASSRPGWHVTSTGRIVRPIRMRPEKPLPPVSATTSGTAGKKGEKKKRKREKPKLIRARRRTIDPTKWDSQHLKDAFLDSIVVADDGDDPPVTTPSQPRTLGDQGESDLSSSEEEGDESDSSEPEHIVEGSPTTSKSADRPSHIVHTKLDAVDSEHDFNQEKLRALSLLDSIFGGLGGDREWGGKEALDSDVDMPELSSVQTSLPKSSPPKEIPKRSDLIPTTGVAQVDPGSEESSDTSTPAPERTHTPVTTQNVNTKAKLKDLFAPQEEQGGLPLTKYISHT